MSTRIVALPIAAVLSLLSTVAAAHVAPAGPACVMPPAGPTEKDTVYYLSTIAEQLTYAKLREDTPRRASVVAVPGLQKGTRLSVWSGVGPLTPMLCPTTSSLCPAPSQLMSRLDAVGCRP